MASLYQPVSFRTDLMRIDRYDCRNDPDTDAEVKRERQPSYRQTAGDKRETDMKYSIGDVSQALNLSREMIRYYEKNGVLKLTRDSSSNYRNYEIMDIFWLMESLQYRSWGVSIPEIQKIREDSFHIQTAGFLEKQTESLDQEILKKTMLKERLSEVVINMRQSFYNLDNVWIRYIPPYYSFHLVNGRGDSYDQINVDPKIREIYFAGDIIGFLDNGIIWHEESQEWVMQMDEKYVRALDLPVLPGMSYEEGGLYICSNADIGDIGSFDTHAPDRIRAYAETKQIICSNKIRGVLIGRGKVNDRFRRIVEFRMRIQDEKS